MRPSRGPLALAAALLLAPVAVVALLTRNGDDLRPLPPRVVPVLDQSRKGPLGSAAVPLDRWRYRADPADRGQAEGWARGGFGGQEVGLPFSPNAKATSGPGTERGYQGTVGWYARTIDAPVAGRYALSFASAHHDATVYLDGRRVRRHVGAYEPFTAIAELAAGRHAVSVRVDWRDPRAQSRAGFGRGWFSFGGLDGPVSLTRTGRASSGRSTWSRACGPVGSRRSASGSASAIEVRRGSSAPRVP